jgi:hypothetical protein
MYKNTRQIFLHLTGLHLGELGLSTRDLFFMYSTSTNLSRVVIELQPIYPFPFSILEFIVFNDQSQIYSLHSC